MPLTTEYQAMLAQLAAQPGPPLSALAPADGRAMYRMMRPLNPDIAVGSVTDLTIPGPAGRIPVRIYGPPGPGPFPVFVNFHGGGWVIGDLETCDAICRDLQLEEVRQQIVPALKHLHGKVVQVDFREVLLADSGAGPFRSYVIPHRSTMNVHEVFSVEYGHSVHITQVIYRPG